MAWSKEKHREYMREYMRKRYANMTQEERSAYNAKRKHADNAVLKNEKDSAKAQRLIARRLAKCAYAKQYRESNPEYVKRCIAQSVKNRYEKVYDSYLATKLGRKVSECPKEILELMRERVLLVRATKQLEEVIANA